MSGKRNVSVCRGHELANVLYMVFAITTTLDICLLIKTFFSNLEILFSPFSAYAGNLFFILIIKNVYKR